MNYPKFFFNNKDKNQERYANFAKKCQDFFRISMNIGQHLKTLRIEQDRTLHQVAVGTDIDATILSKIERSERLPTETQIINLARFFNTELETLKVKAIADKIVKDYGLNDTTLNAIGLEQEQFFHYSNNKKNE